jgi:predicted negative regulator of RcsB-dependent stress response
MSPTTFRPLLLSLLLAAAAQAQTPPAAPPPLRAELMAPLQAAQQAIADKRFDEALRQLQAAEAVPGRSPYETYLVQRLRVAVAVNQRDMPTLLAAGEAVLSSEHLETELRAGIADQVGLAAYAQKEWDKAVRWTRVALEGVPGSTGQRLRLAQALYFLNRHGEALQTLDELAARQQAAGEKPGEPQLRLVASTQSRLGDEAGYTRTLERLIALYPKPDYWADRLSRLTRQPGFDERLALDALRLGRQVGAWTTPEPLLALADAAQRAGFVAEARAVVEAGFARGVLGQGAAAAEHQALRQRLEARARSDAAPDPKEAAAREPAVQFATGWDLYTRGQAADGIALMQQAVQRGLARQADDARLRLAGALVASGRADDARALLTALRDGGSKDGLADLARLWLLQAGG